MLGKGLLRFAVFAIYLFMLIPILIVVPVSFTTQQYVVFPPTGFTFRWYENFFQSGRLVSSLLLSLRLAISATFIATSIGTLAAVAVVRFNFRGRAALRSFFLSPIIVPGLVVGIALLLFFGPTLLRGTFTLLLFAHVVVIVPFVIRTVMASLAGIGNELEFAAQSLGASPITAFRTITLPLLRPGIVAGAMLAFVQSFDELVVSLFLTGPRLSTLPVEIYHYLEYNSDPTIAAISVIVVIFSSGLILLTEKFVGISRFL